MGISCEVLDASCKMPSVSDLSDPPLCPSCGQPGSAALAGAEHGWECRNEACPEFGQALQEHEPPPLDAPDPGRQGP